MEYKEGDMVKLNTNPYYKEPYDETKKYVLGQEENDSFVDCKEIGDDLDVSITIFKHWIKEKTEP
jgi:hypothetical protein